MAGKPRKVGILYFLEKDKKKKQETSLRRFCILTSSKEIDYYSQEVVCLGTIFEKTNIKKKNFLFQKKL